MEYKKRFADRALADRLQSSGAVLIEGTKGCGKTETAKQIAGSQVQRLTMIRRGDIQEREGSPS